MARLAASVCACLSNNCMELGRLTARDVWIMLRTADSSEATSESELQQLLDTLASTLVRAVDGDPNIGYVLSSSSTVTNMRLMNLGISLTSDEALVDA